MAGSQNGRLSRPCAMGGNFGFRGPIGLSGLDFFRSFWGNAKKDNKKTNIQSSHQPLTTQMIAFRKKRN
jgi:hypothetical protein